MFPRQQKSLRKKRGYLGALFFLISKSKLYGAYQKRDKKPVIVRGNLKVCLAERMRGIPLLLPCLFIKGFLQAAFVEMTSENNIMFFVVKIFFNTGRFFLIFARKY